MSPKSTTGSAASSVQKWIIDSDVENQLRSKALRNRLHDDSLSNGSIEIKLRFHNLAAIGWGEFQPFSTCYSMLRIDLSGCPKLESIPEMTFDRCHHLASVVFGEHINITNLGEQAFAACSALTSITLPNKLEVIETGVFSSCTSLELVVYNKHLKTIGENAFHNCPTLTSITLPNKLKIIEEMAFSKCTSLKRVVYNKKLKTIGEGAFQLCPKLEDDQLAPSSISFGQFQFTVCDHLIEVAAAAGFPSTLVLSTTGVEFNAGAGVVPYLIHQFERSERKRMF